MGQAQTSSVWRSYAPNSDIAPGTYRIVHDGTNKVLLLQEEDSKTLILQPRQDPSSDSSPVEGGHWFLVRSGDGYVFKHCRQGTYITGLLSPAASPQSVCATRYPTTWAIHTKEGATSKCAITVAVDSNESGSGAKYVGLGVVWAGLCIAPLSEKEEPEQVWRLERIGDATVEEDYAHRARELERALQEANARWDSSESKLKAMRRQLEAKEADLGRIQGELSKQAADLEDVRSELTQQAAGLKEQYEALDTIRDLLGDKERALSEKDKGPISETTVCEKEEEISEEAETLEAPEETVVNEQAPELTTPQSQTEDANNTSWPNELVSESSSGLETSEQVVQSPVPPVALDQKLANLGWSFD